MKSVIVVCCILCLGHAQYGYAESHPEIQKQLINIIQTKIEFILDKHYETEEKLILYKESPEKTRAAYNTAVSVLRDLKKMRDTNSGVYTRDTGKMRDAAQKLNTRLMFAESALKWDMQKVKAYEDAIRDSRSPYNPFLTQQLREAKEAAKRHGDEAAVATYQAHEAEREAEAARRKAEQARIEAERQREQAERLKRENEQLEFEARMRR